MAPRAFGVRVAGVVRATGAPHDLVLRDYALSYMLAAIYSDVPLSDAMAFKGGTALRKCFFRGYRFSEDLDFTLREPTRSWRGWHLVTSTGETALRPSSGDRAAVARTDHPGLDAHLIGPAQRASP
jgi:nucleotidyltransferase AbiEii toxin of type IV toxin-antitoxin system